MLVVHHPSSSEDAAIDRWQQFSGCNSLHSHQLCTENPLIHSTRGCCHQSCRQADRHCIDRQV